MTSKVLSLYFDESVIKIAHLRVSKNNITVYNCFTAAMPEGAVEDGFIRDSMALSGAVKSVLIENSIRTKDAFITIGSSRIASRDIEIPYVRKNKIEALVNANAPEYFPVNVSNHIISYKVISEIQTEEGRKIRLSVYAVPERLLEGYVALMDALGLNVKYFDCAGNSSAQLMADQVGKGTNLVIQMEHNNSIVSVISHGQLRLQRIIPYGRNTMSAVSGFPAAEASAALEPSVKTSSGTSSMTAREADDSERLKDSLMYMISSVSRVIDYYNSKYRDEPITNGYLAGESTDIKGINEVFEKEISFLNNSITGFNNVKIAAPQADPVMAAKYINCIGAVKSPVGFKTRELEEQEKRKKRIYYLRLGVLCSIFLSLVMVASALPRYLGIKSDIRFLKGDIKNLQHVQAKVDDYYAAKDQYEDGFNFMKDTLGNNDRLEVFFRDLERISPSDIIVQSFSVNNGSVGISAITSTKDTIGRYIAELKGLDYVTDVYVSSMSENKDVDGNISTVFSISCLVSAYQADIVPGEEDAGNVMK